MKKLLATTAITTGLLLTGCAGVNPTPTPTPTPPPQPTHLSSEEQSFANTLTQLGNTAIPAFQQQAAVAMAETPPNVHVAQCAGTMPTTPTDPTTGTGALSVAVAIQKLGNAAGPNPTPLTQATILLAFAPNSAQWDWAQEQIETGCVAALQDAINAGKATAADIANLNIATVLAVAAVN